MDELDMLRVKIAKALGWRYCQYKPSSHNRSGMPAERCLVEPSYVHENEYWIETELDLDKWPADLDNALQQRGDKARIPDWPRDIAAAWELVKEAECQGVGFNLANEKFLEDGRIEYEATFYDPWGGPLATEYQISAPTAPEAISRAYFAWKEGKSK